MYSTCRWMLLGAILLGLVPTCVEAVQIRESDRSCERQRARSSERSSRDQIETAVPSRAAGLTMRVDQVRAVLWEGGDTHFAFDITLNNSSGRDLKVRTNFHSALDALDMVVTDTDGKLLVRRGYTYHQSPASQNGSEKVLPNGISKAQMLFPISDFGTAGQQVHVQLIGLIDAKGFSQSISSKKLRVTIRPRKLPQPAQTRLKSTVMEYAVAVEEDLFDDGSFASYDAIRFRVTAPCELRGREFRVVVSSSRLPESSPLRKKGTAASFRVATIELAKPKWYWGALDGLEIEGKTTDK